jgi:hypothetical protein
METCEITFDETQPCNSSVFECAGDDEVFKKIFEDEEDDAGEDDGDDGEAPAVDAKCALNANHTASRKASFARAESK